MEVFGSAPLIKAVNLASLIAIAAILGFTSYKIFGFIRAYLSARNWGERFHTSLRCAAWITLSLATMWLLILGVAAVNGFDFLGEMSRATQRVR